MNAGRLLGLMMALGALLIAAGCGGGGGTTPGGSATVQGTLLDDATLEPVAGAIITIGTTGATSAANGGFTVSTTAGSRTIAISASGYQQRSLSRTLAEGSNSLGTQYLRPVLLAGRGAATGTVTRGGSAATGATLLSGTARAVSKADGSYAIYNLETGQRAITAISSDGQSTGVAAASIAAEATRTGVNISLALAPPPPPTL